MKLFLGFVLISGVGWLLDMMSYAAFSQLAGMAPAYANFISSLVGVTYVWFIAINRLFNRREYGKSIYLPVYWGYQGASILAYSALISIVAASAINSKISEIFGVPFGLVAKIIITAPNLLTNFIFMTILTRFMKPGGK
jgi:putative flippase GtrA